jgi:hypothetical protein
VEVVVLRRWMAVRERNDCTDEGLVPRALAIQSSLLPSSTQRRMSSSNFLSETLWFIPTRATARYFRAVAGCATGSTHPKGAHVRDGLLGLYRLYPGNRYHKARSGGKQPSRDTPSRVAFIQRSAWKGYPQKVGRKG